MTLSPEWQISPQLVDYESATTQMEQRVADIQIGSAPELIWGLEHPPLYTAGSSAQQSDWLGQNNIPVFQTGRGGQYTYHGPGQRVIYAMLDLKKRMQPHPDLRRFVWLMEEWVIRTLAHFEVKGERRDGRIGIWVVRDNGAEDKIGAIGIRVRKWVSYHGLCINVNPDLSHYQGIIPCGIRNHGVTSLAELGKAATLERLDAALKAEFIQVFEDNA